MNAPTFPYDTARLSELAQLLIDNVREPAQAGWTPATSSNFSHRLDDRHAAITVSGKDKGRLIEDDIMVVDFDGKAVGRPAPPPKPCCTPSCTAASRKSAAYCTPIRRCRPLPRALYAPQGHVHLEGYELLKAFAGNSTHEMAIDVPVFANTQDMNVLQQVDDLLDRQNLWGYLIDGHGLYAGRHGRGAPPPGSVRVPVPLRTGAAQAAQLNRRAGADADPESAPRARPATLSSPRRSLPP